MPGIYPNPSAAAESFRVGDQVRWFVNEQSISPYVGVVTQICPSICKVWVEFPIGGNQQKDPTELILVTPFAGRSPVTEDTGYSSYEKEVSEKDYGTLREKTVKLAQRMVAKEIGSATEKTMLSKMASKVAKNFAEGVVEKLAGDVLQCVESKMTDAQAYQSLYPQYETVCSDGFLRTAISKIYSSWNESKYSPIERKRDEEDERGDVQSIGKFVYDVDPKFVAQLNALSARMGLQETIWATDNPKAYAPNVTVKAGLIYIGPKDVSKFYREAERLGLIKTLR